MNLHDGYQIPKETIEVWQEIADLIATISNVPAGLVMRLTNEIIEVFVSSKTQQNPYKVGASEFFENSGLYCEAVVKTKNRLLIPNALKDEHWKHNPDIKLNMISYLGFPILYPDGTPFGTFCILDSKENHYSEKIEKLMLKLKALIQKDLELVYLNNQLGDRNRKLLDYVHELQVLRGFVPICANCKNIQNDTGNWNAVEHYLLQNEDTELTHTICPKCMKKLYPELNIKEEE